MPTNPSTLFLDVRDPRVVNRCDHKLSDILFISLCTLLCNGEDFEDMVEFGTQRYDWLCHYLELPNGIPCADTFNRVLQRLDPEELEACLRKDGQTLLDYLSEDQICFDGKKIKGVSPHSKGNQGFYILSAWSSQHTLCIGQSKVEDKSNEIQAIPTLIDQLDLAGGLVSIDAIGCQKTIASKLIRAQADYLLSLKHNQKSTFEDVVWLFGEVPCTSSQEEWEYDHGRYETRKCSIIKVSSTQKQALFDTWEGLTTLVKIESSRLVQEKQKKRNTLLPIK